MITRINNIHIFSLKKDSLKKDSLKKRIGMVLCFIKNSWISTMIARMNVTKGNMEKYITMKNQTRRKYKIERKIVGERNDKTIRNKPLFLNRFSLKKRIHDADISKTEIEEENIAFEPIAFEPIAFEPK